MTTNSRMGMPLLPDPKGDDLLFKQRIVEAVKELYRQSQNAALRLEAAEGEILRGRGRG